jgi:UDP-N-acetylglucosamine 2-epimerase (non-hydrolysing)
MANPSQPTALCIVGTRPECIKMAPVIKALRERGFQVPILATGQHRQLLDQVLKVFRLESTWDLNAMQANQNLSELLGRILPALDRLIRECKASVVLAQGDTTTVFAAAMAAFHAQVPFGHVEAGLRSGRLDSPFPEEGNRRLASVLTRFHFAPTETSRRALLAEGVADNHIHVVGNTVIDALLEVCNRQEHAWPEQVPHLRAGERLALVTLHRRENFGAPLRGMLSSLRRFAAEHPETRIVYPVHPNPNVTGPAHEILGAVANVHLIEPVEYPALVGLLSTCHAVFTDSGGLQEEAPALGKPVLVFRDVTERPEAVAAGGVKLVGSDPKAFLDEAGRLWEDPDHYSAMAQPRFPYGDGKSSERIAKVLAAALPQA